MDYFLLKSTPFQFLSLVNRLFICSIFNLLSRESIGVGGGGGDTCPPPPLEINSGKFEIIRALNFGEDLFENTL